MKKRRLLLLSGIILIAGFVSAQCPSASFTSTAPACQGSSINFTNTSGNTGGGWTYFWDFDYPNGGGASPATSTAQNPTNVNYSPGGNGVYTVAFTITNVGLGCTSTVLIDIDIRTARADFISSVQNTCVGDSTYFYNTGTLGTSPFATVTHSWSFGQGAIPSTSNAVNPPPVIYTTAGAKTITHLVTVNYSSCGGGIRNDVFTQTITVNPSPSPSFTSNTPACEGSPVSFNYTGGGGVTFAWDFGVGASPQNSTSQNSGNIMYSTPGTKTVTLTTVNAYGCSSTITQNITIDATPVASFTSTAPQCTGLPVDFTNTGTSSGSTYLWNFGPGATPATSTAQNPTGIVYSTAGTKIVTLTITNSSTGCAVTTTQTININQTPTATFTSNAPQCAGSAVNFVNTGSSGSNWSFFWDFGAGANTSTSTSENPSGVTYSSGGTKTITFTISGGGCTQTSTQNITINALPVAFAGLDTIICANTSVQLGTANTAGYTYSWFPSSTLSNGSVSNPVASPVAPQNNYVVLVTETATGCSASDSVLVTMLSPLMALAGPDGVICRYDSVQLGAALIEGQNYSWLPTAGLSSATSPNPVASPDVTTTYTLSVAGGGCPAETDEVTVIVHQLPLANAGVDDTITNGSSVQLVATGGVQYSWSPANGLSNTGIYNPVANPSDTQTYIVTVIDIYGCVNSDTMTVFVIEPDFWLPTAFTPDGNQVNDVLFVRGEGITGFEFGIYDRWGELVFVTKDMLTGWDGRRMPTNEELPAGAYMYYIKGTKTNGDPVDQKGLVNLIR